MLNILLLCSGNATRSILGEAIFNRDGAGRVRAYSAGSNPLGMVHPGSLRLLAAKGLPIRGYRSKSWHEFATDRSEPLDLIITLCAEVAGERNPRWHGAPLRWHWDVDEPTAIAGEQKELSFQLTYHQLSSRINGFLILPLEEMTRADLKHWIDGA